MQGIFKMIGGFVIIALLMVHLLIVSLFLIPIPKLLGLVIKSDFGFLTASEIPEAVEDFLVQNKVEITSDYKPDSDFKVQILASILEVRRSRFMTPSEQLALDMNLLDFGEGIIGLGAASEYYYKKPLLELADKEWITLINLQKIFSKK